ncbi:MAG TPA: hypothetical protein VMZ91_07375 [Candidatus Paceibacterota bacterium]|nr:hypothetical protein [Candidatus Paceibacterota bacterium]
MPLERIMKEKTSADHLLYVSLKYTKTCDVMLNLLERWKSMMDFCADALLEKIKKKKIITAIPIAPKMKIDVLRDAFKKSPEIIETLDLYEFFKRVPTLDKIRECEFRKNVCLKIMDKGEEVRIDLEKLKEYSEKVERFIKFIREFLSS